MAEYALIDPIMINAEIALIVSRGGSNMMKGTPSLWRAPEEIVYANSLLVRVGVDAVLEFDAYALYVDIVFPILLVDAEIREEYIVVVA